MGHIIDFIKKNKDKFIIIIYFGVYLFIGITMIVSQPFGNPPDEYNRFLIPEFIAKYGVIPNGYDEEIRIGGYGFSYGFQPILPYMLQGYAMRFVSLFTNDGTLLLYTARGVDLLLGAVMAFFTMLLGREWFADRRLAWFFSFFVTFLPQSIFIHTYVNTDSCCMLSIVIILYALTKGFSDDFSGRSLILLSVGIILCALSYYNAYGYILSSILLFIAHFLSTSALKEDFPGTIKKFLKKGIFISLIVLAGIGWWFIRSYILYDGDILGLRTRDYCGMLYALPEFAPGSRFTYRGSGCSIIYMMFNTDFFNLTTLSFIGIFGAMTIVSTMWLYRFYKLLFGLGFILELILGKKQSKAFRLFWHMNMLMCILIPIALSLWYSYSVDYQPQGRYVLPALVPLCYYCVAGYEKMLSIIKGKSPAKSFAGDKLISISLFLTCGAMLILLFITVFNYAIPYYIANPIAP